MNIVRKKTRLFYVTRIFEFAGLNLYIFKWTNGFWTFSIT